MKWLLSWRAAWLYTASIVIFIGAQTTFGENPSHPTPGAESTKSTAHILQRPVADNRQGGETIDDAVVIGGIPYEDSGATCDNLDDYDEVCPYDGSQSPDVVYAYTPVHDIGVDIDLCFSQYDTKLYVYDEDLNLIACNDDYYSGNPCGNYVSFLEHVPLVGGETYYIVVDGYGGDCGAYELGMWDSWFGPPVHCPDEHIDEGEPPPQDGYVDNYNATCEQAVPFAAEFGTNCWTMCAVGGLYTTDGSEHFDRDWFVCQPVENEIPVTVSTEGPLLVTIYTGSDCTDLTLVTSEDVYWWEPSTFTIPTVGVPLVFLEIASTEYGFSSFDYIVEICGIDPGPVATEVRSWSAVKAAYL